MTVNSISDAKVVDWRTVVQFVALCFGLTWGVEGFALAMGVTLDSSWGTALMAGVMFLPAISAFIVLRSKTGSGKITELWRLGPWRAYVAVWFGVPLVVAIIYALSWQLGLAEFEATADSILKHLPALPAGKQLPPTPILLLAVALSSLTIGVLVTSVFTFGEEYGWTGFLLPALLPLGIVRAVLCYGLVWGLWHAPLVMAGFNYPGYPVVGVAMMCLFTIGVGAVQCALLLRFRSFFVTTFLHASINSQARGLVALLFAGVHPLLGGMVGLVGCAVIGLVGVMCLMTLTPQDNKQPPLGGNI